LLDAVATALQQDHARLAEEARSQHGRKLFEALSGREREVLVLVVQGLLNKQIAHRLNLSEVTVKAHRRHLMTKLGAGSLADLVRMTLGLNASSTALNNSELGDDE
jgi:FixJ family two-component response regulator